MVFVFHRESFLPREWGEAARCIQRLKWIRAALCSGYSGSSATFGGMVRPEPYRVHRRSNGQIQIECLPTILRHRLRVAARGRSPRFSQSPLVCGLQDLAVLLKLDE